LAVMLFMVIAAALIRLDMSLTGVEYFAAVCLVIAGPFLTLIAAMEWKHNESILSYMPPLIVATAYAANALWLTFVLYICKVTEQEGGALLPTGFRSVMYIDVFGWIRRTAEQRRLLASREGRMTATEINATASSTAPREAGRGPAVEAVRYDEQGRPIPLRPEQLEGAANNFAFGQITEEDRRRFRPSSFVPAERGEASNQAASSNEPKPGTTPWRIFFWATVLLIIVWWVSGALIFAENKGWSALRVSRLLSPEDSRVEAGPEPLQELEAITAKEEFKTPSIMLSQLQAELRENQLREEYRETKEEILSSPFHAGGSDKFKATWPHHLVKPASLACSDTADGGVAFVASSRFGLFAATLPRAASSKKVKLAFSPSHPCESVDGELLQDVALRCSPTGAHTDPLSGCEALVLHQQGQRLSKCELANVTKGIAATGNGGNLVNGWLGDGDAVHDHQEEITHVALAKSCHSVSGGDCAYA